MPKCGYCNDKITMAPLGFSGVKDVFCQTCWSKINTAFDGIQIINNEPQVLKWVVQIKL